MPLLKNNKNVDRKEIKRGEEKLKSIMGGKILHNAEFLRLLRINNIPDNAWGKINSQVKMELEDGLLTYADIEERVNQLVAMESPNSRLISLAEADAMKTEDVKRDILAKGKLSIQIPYQSSGVGDVAIGTAVFGRNGAILGAMNEGETKWKNAILTFIDEGISVKTTGDVVLYDDIKSVVLGEKGFIHTIATIITHNDNGLICKVGNTEASAFKSIIEDHLTHDIKPTNNSNTKLNDDADILLKYADLYERGYITREEFDLKKEQLFNGNIESVQDESTSKAKYCGNCGSMIESDSNFCTNCGQQL